ncbi:MAG TPA: hypothetical protein VFI06_00505 [Chitinophagaceae bacterium]|nr:hypothetical protein [Chitinophagaceae bacterium]
MKTVFHLCVVAVISFAALSCTKSDFSRLTAENPSNPNTDPYISSKIERNIVDPGEMELGTASAIIHQGEKVTIFVPYTIGNEVFSTATITMTDDATGLPIKTYDLLSYNDESSAQLTLPATVSRSQEFYFISFVADESYTGKTISITSLLEGHATSSTAVIQSAFSVEP